MKNLILGIAVLGLAIACKNTDNTSISDSSTAAAPAGAEAGCEGGTCPMQEGAGCDMDSDDCDGGGCDMDSDDCDGGTCEMGADGAKVCPVTGKVMEN